MSLECLPQRFVLENINAHRGQVMAAFGLEVGRHWALFAVEFIERRLFVEARDDALVIRLEDAERRGICCHHRDRGDGDRKSTRLNSSHVASSYAVFCSTKKRTSLARRRTASGRRR